MKKNEIENINHLLKTYYGATKVLVDKDLLEVYGSDIESVHTAVVVEYGNKYDIFYKTRNDDLKHVVLQLVKKSKKNIDRSKTI